MSKQILILPGCLPGSPALRGSAPGFRQRCRVETHMTGAATQVQQSCSALPGQFGLEQRELGALSMYCAAQVGRGLFAELFLHDLGVGSAGHDDVPGFCVAVAGPFASKPAPTFDRVPSVEMQSNVGAGLLAKGPVRSTWNQASRNNQGWLARCLVSNAAIASPSCKVRPMSSRPLIRQCLRKASTSK
jgi:hypothetical protein